jgi:hypothetical protein
MNARKKIKPRNREPQEIYQAPLIKVKGPEKFILSSELEARYEAALYGWDYHSILAAKALARLASADMNECMAAIDAARGSLRIDLNAVRQRRGDKDPAMPQSKPANAEVLAWEEMDVWFHVVHAFKSSIGDALTDATLANDQSRSKKGSLIKKRLKDAVNYLLVKINVEDKPKRHGNALLVQTRGRSAAFIPFVAAVILTFLECARIKGGYLHKEELKKKLAIKYNDRTFQRKKSEKGLEEILQGSKISELNERTWSKVFNEAGLKFTRPKSSWIYRDVLTDT